MLTTTVFLDLGQGFAPGGLDLSVEELRDINGLGPDADRTTGPDLQNMPNGTPVLDPAASLNLSAIGLDFNGDGLTNAADLDQLADRVLSIARQAFEPLNIDVQLASASSSADVVASLAANGDTLGNHDAYVFAMATTAGGLSVGEMLGLLGRAARVDLGDPVIATGVVSENNTDEAAIAFAEKILAEFPDPNDFAQALAFVAIHEASHTLGLAHTRDATPEEGLLSTGDLMRQGSMTREGVNIFTRFDLDLTNSPLLVNNYEELTSDANIGYRDDNGNLVPDLAYVTGTGAHDHIKIVDNGGGSVLVTVDAYSDAEKTSLIRSETYRLTLGQMDVLGTEGRVVVDASFGDDLVEISVNHTGNTDFTFEVRGGAGNDHLSGEFRGANLWTVDGEDAGNLNNRLAFAGVENLAAGSRGRADSFVIAAGGSLTGNIDGREGNDTLDLSALAAPRITPLAPGAIDGFDGQATGLGGSFLNINSVVGDGSQTIVGPDAPADWQINGNSVALTFGGNTYKFDSVAAIQAGSDADTFSVLGSAPSPAIAIDGGAGEDSLLADVAADQTWQIDGAGSGNVNSAIEFTGMENLAGAAMTSNDTFVFLPGGSVPGNVDGGSGLDTLDFSTVDSQSLLLTGLGSVDGFDGTGSTHIGGAFLNIDAIVGSTVGGGDTIQGLDLPTQWSIMAIDDVMQAGGRTLSLSLFETHRGGADADSFLVAAMLPVGLLTINGGAGNDSLLVDALVARTWQIDGAGSGNVNGALNFDGIENLAGGGTAAQDTFAFLPGGSIAGKIDGGGGEDTLDFSAADSQSIVLTELGSLDGVNGTSSPLVGGGFMNMNTLIGSTAGDADELTGLDATAEWLLEGDNGSLRTSGLALAFTGFEFLAGGSEADYFSIAGVAPPRMISVAGAGGDDTLEVNLGEQFNWTIQGAGSGSVVRFDDQVLFDGIENLVGDALAGDLFNFGADGSIAGNIDGRGGEDLINLVVAAPQVVGLSGLGAVDGFDGTSVAVIGGTFLNIDRIFANSQVAHQFTGLDSATDWLIEGGRTTMTAAGRELELVNFQSLLGGSEADNFQVTRTPEGPLLVDGGAGEDSLLADFSAVQTWQIDGVGSGNINGLVAFAGMENLAGAAMTSDDTFVFLPGGSVPGNVDGGSGFDTLDFSAADSVSVTPVAPGAVDGYDGTVATLIGGSFLNMNRVVGSQAGLADEILGRDVAAQWQIMGDTATYTADGATIEIADFETLQGGSDSDLFIATGSAPSGPIAIAAGDGNDTLQVSFADSHRWTIDGSDSGNVDGLLLFSEVENIGSTSTDADDTFAFLIGGSISGDVDGLGGIDTLDLSAVDSMRAVALTDTGAVDGFDGLTALGPIGGAFHNINAIIGTTAADDILMGINRLTDWIVDGAGGTLRSGGETLAFSQFENLRGGDATDRFAVMNTEDGSTLDLFGAMGNDEFTVLATGVDSTLSIIGAYGPDTFHVAGSGVGSTVDLRGNEGKDKFLVTGTGQQGEVRAYGGQGLDEFTITASAAGSFVRFFGNAGADLFQVGGGNLLPHPGNLDLIEGQVIVRAVEGTDLVRVNDEASGLPATYDITPTSVTTVNADGSPRSFGGLIYDGTAENLTVVGSAEANLFRVVPSESTEYELLAGDPTGDPANGDRLEVDFTGTTGRKLTFSDRAAGDGEWTFDNRAAVRFANFENFNYFPLLAIAPDLAEASQPLVRVYDAETKELQFEFFAYEADFQGGVRTALGDLDGDGIPEVVTAPGPLRKANIRAFDVLSGQRRPEFSVRAYAKDYLGGVQVAVGDVNGDGYGDIITAPGRGTADIRVFENRFATAPDAAFTNDQPSLEFRVFNDDYLGGASVAAADINGDGRAEVIVGSGTGTDSRAKVFDLSDGTAVKLDNFMPLDGTLRGGVFVAAGDVNGDGIADIIVGAGVRGGSQIEIFDGANGALLESFTAFPEIDNSSSVRIAAKDFDGDGVIDHLFAALGSDKQSDEIRQFTLDGTLVDSLVEDDELFFGGYYLG